MGFHNIGTSVEPAADGDIAAQVKVGARIKQLRESRGLSIRALAAAAGLNHSSVSQIEMNKVSPSVSSLKRILGALGVSLTAFFAEVENDMSNKIFYHADELVELSKDSKVSYRQIGADLTGKAIMMLHEVYQPGGDTGEPYVHNAEECGIVISGRLTLVVGNEQRVLSSGDAYYFDSKTPHRMFNPFEEVCVVVSAVTPPTF